MRKTRRAISLILAILAALLLSGCGGGGATPATAPRTEAPQSHITGYYTSDQSVSGGTAMQYVNLRDIKIEKLEADTVITLEFRDGSLQMGMPEQPTKGVPKYSTQWIEGMDRLVLNISGLGFWDYKVWDDEIKDTPIQGIFKQVPVDDADEMLTKLYINLKGDVAYKVEERDNLLILSMRSVPEEEHDNYYVMINAFDEYTDGIIGEDEGFTPTLCSDKMNVTLVSKPFASEADANAFLAEKKTLLAKLPDRNAVVQKLKSNQLPDYDEKGMLSAYANASVMINGTTESSAPVLITNGKLLCWRPDGMAYVYVTPFFMDSPDGSDPESYEKIYINDLNTNTPTLLTDFEYSSITKAEFSEDGRYLAFLVEENESRMLCIYDFKNSARLVATASEAGFGVDTANFTWGSGANAHAIYAITGEGETLQLMSYTLADDGTPKVETLVEDAFTDGSMGYLDGKVYYSQASDEASKNGIYSFDVAEKKTVRVCDGASFELNRMTGVMAIITGEGKQIQIYSIRSDVRKDLYKGNDVYDVVWSGDGSMLYYLLYKYNTETEDRYKLTLYRYNTHTGESTAITDIVEGLFRPSDKNSELLLICTYSDDERSVPITYRISTGE